MGRTLTRRPEQPDHSDHSAQGDRPAPAIALWLVMLIDLAAVVIFVLAGRRSHGESDGLAGVWVTAWPFLAGLAAGYLGLLLTRRRATSLAGGAVVAGKTVVLGLVLRYSLQNNDVPLSFAIVATLVLSALIIGWRAAAARILARR